MSPRTYLLAAGAFAVGTSGYIVSGVLPAVSHDLNVSAATAGQLVTAFAIAYAIASPLLAAATGRWERRRLLVVALLVSAAGNVMAALAPTYELLLVSRVVSALGAAVFTPAATAVATILNPPERRGRAVAMVFGGLTFALILGVPAGNLVGGSIGYQGVFALVALVSLLGAVAVQVGIPVIAAPPAVGLRDRLAAARDSRVLMMLAMTVLACLAAFSVFTYIAPLLTETAGVHGTTISLLLFVYGVGGAIGNSLGGRMTDRYGSGRPLLVIFTVFIAVLATLPLTAVSAVSAGVVLFVWGMFTWSVNPPIQNWLIELAPANSGLVLSLNASAIYLGVGLSGVFGGVVISSAGLLALPPIAAAVAAISLVLLFLNTRQSAVEPVLSEAVLEKAAR
ncbi:putative MFS family arabinose efflux permease [Kibdelosporangium banguiense]|uniref:MFS family arabinose efflux permease n=1 Tax=Kibdelosporangium banguiense TaxID=1365924 RepID=A0ABS4TIZ2_9PSEU|nr:MFS transporter [Kibdelosporangium banguiense]MBP2324391.1 putative MFS family arabinose efflux permease [Kibdelosporangium banguiense]